MPIIEETTMFRYIAVHVTTGILLNLAVRISPFQRVTTQAFQSSHADLGDSHDESVCLTVAAHLNINFDPSDPQQAFYILSNDDVGPIINL